MEKSLQGQGENQQKELRNKAEGSSDRRHTVASCAEQSHEDGVYGTRAEAT